MRKEQAKIIEKARKKALDNRYIEVLEKEDLTIKQLKLIYDYIVGNKKYGEDKILNEIDKYIFYDCDDHTKENILLPYRDKLIGEDEKKKLIVENQKKYYEEFWDWSDKEKIISYMFEAFDEPWKGGNRPNEAEKNWGIFRVDRTPKLIMQKIVR